MIYIIKNKWGQIKFICEAKTSLELRKYCREFIGRRKSVRLQYKQIGANSFRIENCLGFTVLYCYKYAR